MQRFVPLTIVGLVLLAAAGCGRSDEERAQALCDEWAWDPGVSAEGNMDAYSEVWDTLDSDGTVDLEGMARQQCPGHFREYDRAAAEHIAQLREEAGLPPEPGSSSGGGGSVGAGSSAGTDTSTADFLASRGVTDSMVRQLGYMADATGYGLSPGTPLPFDQAQNFAFVIVGVCDEVAGGRTTWASEVDRDVASGAPLGDAQQMNGYLRDVFCPQVL